MWKEAVVADLSNILEFTRRNCGVREFEVLRTVIIKSCVFWDRTQRSPFRVSKDHVVSIFRFEE
jgi:hypothetical protein